MRENRRTSIQLVGEPDALERCNHLLASDGPGHPIERSEKQHLIDDRDIAGEDGILRHHRDPADQRSRSRCGTSQHFDRAPLHAKEPGDQREEGGLAGTVGADQPHHAALIEFPVDVVDRHLVAEAMAQLLDLQERRGIDHRSALRSRSSAMTVKIKPCPRQ